MTRPQHQTLKLIVAAAMLLTAMIVVVSSNGGPSDVSGRWYYDLGTGELFLDSVDDLAPIVAPSGGEGVRAHVFACGDCGDASRRQVAYLSKYSESDKLQIISLREQAASDPEQAGSLRVKADIYAAQQVLVAGPDGGRWTADAEGEMAMALVAKLSATCPEATPLTDCRPSQ